MVESAEKQWYVLHTYSGYENKVKLNLESRAQSMGMQDYIFRVVVPEEEEHEVKNGKEKIKMDKTFPGYVLVEMVMTDDAWYIVRNTPGVTGFIGSHGQGSKPTPLLPDEVELILKRLGMSSVMKIWTLMLTTPSKSWMAPFQEWKVKSPRSIMKRQSLRSTLICLVVKPALS